MQGYTPLTRPLTASTQYQWNHSQPALPRAPTHPQQPSYVWSNQTASRGATSCHITGPHKTRPQHVEWNLELEPHMEWSRYKHVDLYGSGPKCWGQLQIPPTLAPHSSSLQMESPGPLPVKPLTPTLQEDLHCQAGFLHFHEIFFPKLFQNVSYILKTHFKTRLRTWFKKKKKKKNPDKNMI